jgi:hypothetical protein
VALSGASAELVQRYLAGVALVEAALADIGPAALDRRSDGEWSARMVVHHLADSETNSYVRLRRLLAEPAPITIQGYDEGRWGETPALGYEELDPEISLAVFRAVRQASAAVLARLNDVDLERHGVHTEAGAYSLADWLRIYAEHAEAHAEQIRRAGGAA